MAERYAILRRIGVLEALAEKSTSTEGYLHYSSRAERLRDFVSQKNEITLQEQLFIERVRQDSLRQYEVD